MRRAGALLLLLGGTAAADPPRHNVALEVASELDTNVHRSLDDSGDVESGLAVRGVARWGMAWRPADGHGLAAGVTTAGRALTGGAAREENTFLVGADLRWEASVGTGARLSLAGSYHDLFEDDTRAGGLDVDRDFRSGQGRIALTAGNDDWRVVGSGSGRVFVFKPDAALDFAGLGLGVDLTRTFHLGEEESLVFGLSYALAHRDFTGLARDLGCDGRCTVPTELGRVDLFHTATFSGEWQGDFLAAARYELAVNGSNSVGQSFVRHRVDLSGTVELYRWLLTARLLLQINRAEDDPLAGMIPTIEDESKSAVILHALRPLSRPLSLEIRGAVYAGPLGAPGDFSRTVLSVGLVYASR